MVWFKGSEVIQSAEHSILGTVMNTLYRGPTHSNHSGLYQCMAYGSAGCGRAIATVTVVEAPPTPTGPPVTVSVELLPGFVRCTVWGDMSAINFGVWRLNSAIIGFFSAADGNGSVIVTNASLGETGHYSCEVRLADGQILNDSLLYLEPTSLPPPVESTEEFVQATPTSSLGASPVPTPPPTPSVTVSVTLLGPFAHCFIQGDLSSVSSGAWLLGGAFYGQFSIPDSSSVSFFTSTAVTGPGSYTCRVVLSSGGVVEDSVDYAVATPSLPTNPPTEVVPPTDNDSSPSPSPFPSPSPSPASPSVIVKVQMTSEKVNCILEGDLSAITASHWLVTHGNVILANTSFVTDASKGYFFSSLSISQYATYTCHVTLSNGDTVSDSIHHIDPSSPPPSPPPPPPPPPPLPLPLPHR